MQFDTLREAHEWAYSEAYNEIGHLYDGYITTDEKLAYALLFELVRSNTLLSKRFEVFADVDFGVPNRYRVWVEPAGRTSDSDRAAE